MHIKKSPDPRHNLWHSMALYLRFYRDKAGESGDTFARILKCSRPSISRLEMAEQALKDHEAELLDKRWQTGGLLGNLLWYARMGHDPDWSKHYTEWELKSEVIRTFDGSLTPLHLQTPGYARSLLLAGGVHNPDQAVEKRMRRTAILDRAPTPPELWALVAETALLPVVGGSDVMREQLAHLIAMSTRRNVILRVVPNRTGAHVGLDGAFKIISIREGTIGFLEAAVSGRLELDVDKGRRTPPPI
ncbi:hypothetical protein GCM10022221_35980 [Actinocorallia aurea]